MKFETLTQLTCFMFLSKIGEMLWSYRKCQKNLSLKETGPSYDKKFACSDNPGQNIWNQIEKSSKIGQDNNGLIILLSVF